MTSLLFESDNHLPLTFRAFSQPTRTDQALSMEQASLRNPNLQSANLQSVLQNWTFNHPSHSQSSHFGVGQYGQYGVYFNGIFPLCC
jgi:hypothetical protein